MNHTVLMAALRVLNAAVDASIPSAEKLLLEAEAEHEVFEPAHPAQVIAADFQTLRAAPPCSAYYGHNYLFGGPGCAFCGYDPNDPNPPDPTGGASTDAGEPVVDTARTHPNVSPPSGAGAGHPVDRPVSQILFDSATAIENLINTISWLCGLQTPPDVIEATRLLHEIRDTASQFAAIQA